MSGAPFSWDVELPGRGGRSTAGRPSRARLSVVSQTHGEESWSVPVAVGRRLEALSREGDGPACRSELLVRLGELSRACAHARMEELVGRRDYSARELTDRLLRDGYARSVAEEVVGRAQRGRDCR